MRVIVSGSRSFKGQSWLLVRRAVRQAGFAVTELVHGACPEGADRLADVWAEREGIPVHRFPADWRRYGISAGPMRNESMGRYAEALVAIWDGESRGTRHMVGFMDQRLRKPCCLWNVPAGRLLWSRPLRIWVWRDGGWHVERDETGQPKADRNSESSRALRGQGQCLRSH